MILIQCDECELTTLRSMAIGEGGWRHNSEYDFDACCSECFEKLCKQYYGPPEVGEE